MQDLRKKEPCGCCTVEIKDLCVRARDKVILKDVSFSMRCGELLAVIGPNGGGKTTLVQSLLHLRDYSGQVRFYTKDGASGRPRIGYVPQVLEFDRLAPMTVEDFLASAWSKRPVFLGVSRQVRERVAQALEEVKGEQLQKRKLGRLSGGELQRVLLALALNPTPELLVLDEPVSGIDANGLELFYSLLDSVKAKHDMSILLVSHDLRLVEKHADKAALIDGTLRAFGRPEEVFRTKAFETIFGYGRMEGGERHDALV